MLALGSVYVIGTSLALASAAVVEYGNAEVAKALEAHSCEKVQVIEKTEKPAPEYLVKKDG